MKRKVKYLLCGMMMLFSMCLVMGCSKKETSTSSNGSGEANQQSSTGDLEILSGLHHVAIDVKDYGVIELELDADAAPVTVSNFIDLVNKGFYDGLTFHRIMDGFMMQGGDP